MFLPPASSEAEIFLIAAPISFFFGCVATVIFFRNKWFNDEVRFLSHRNLWLLIALFLSGLIVSNIVIECDTFYTPPIHSFLFVAILLITTLFPATYQYSKKYNKYSAVFPSFGLLGLFALTLYFQHDLRTWLYRDEIAKYNEIFENDKLLKERTMREQEALTEMENSQVTGIASVKSR